MTKALIRPVRLADAESLHWHCYPDADLNDVQEYLAWSLRQVQKGWLARLVAEVDGQVVGQVQLTVWGQTGEIGSLVVGQAFRQQGLARQLLSAAIDQAQNWGLHDLEIEVDERQAEVLAFYQRLGFRVEGTKKRLSHPVSPAPVLRLRMLLRDRQSEKVLSREKNTATKNDTNSHASRRCNDVP